MYKKRLSSPPKPKTLFGIELSRLMNLAEPKISIKDFADSLKITYEYARRLVRGTNVPSRLLILEIARHFKTDPTTLESIARRDRFGKAGVSEPATEMNEDHLLFQKALNTLNESQREMLRKQIEGIIDSK